MSSGTPANIDQKDLTVYFDGACPLCRREINLYRKMNGAETINWVDVAEADREALGPDLTPSTAQRRFHVRRSNGELASGSLAFAELWMAMPSLSWLGRLTALPGIRHIADIAYSGFLVIRPLIQKLMPR